jgi:hypothetical protein
LKILSYPLSPTFKSPALGAPDPLEEVYNYGVYPSSTSIVECPKRALEYLTIGISESVNFAIASPTRNSDTRENHSDTTHSQA